MPLRVRRDVAIVLGRMATPAALGQLWRVPRSAPRGLCLLALRGLDAARKAEIALAIDEDAVRRDLEADLDRAVMVVEWGRDRVEHLSSSVLLVELERPGAEHLPDGEDLQDPDEPRTLRLSTRGARWEGEAVAALAAALEAGGFDVAVSPDENPQDDRTDEVR